MMSYVFIHGLGQNSSSWNHTISFLKNPIHAVCPQLLSLLNNEEVTYTNLYHAFSNYCNSLSEPLTLCGLSLGAILALHYAIDYPAKVQSLILIGAQYKMPKKLIKFQNILFLFMPKKMFDHMGFCKKDVIKLTHSMMDLDFSAKLQNISCAALIICGDKDKANQQAAQDLFQGIPNAKIYFVENASHEVNIEAPEKLAAILNALG